MAGLAGTIQAKKSAASEAVELLFLGFAAGEQAYALGIFAVGEILKIPKIYSLPKVPAFLKGVIDLRGAIVPVLDFRERLGQGAVDLKTGRVVVALLGGKTAGLLVDSVEEVFRATPSDIKQTPDVYKKPGLEFIQGMTRVGDHLYLLIDPSILLTPEEVASLSRQGGWSPAK